MGQKQGDPPSRGRSEASLPGEKNDHAPGPTGPERSDISRMRARLIEELRTPFIEHVQKAPSDTFIKQVKVESFDERVMTLPDKEIFDLYVDYLKTRRIENETTKTTVRKSILDRLELSFFSEGWVLGRILKRR